MPYYTVYQKVKESQLTWEDVAFGLGQETDELLPSSTSGTITRFSNEVPATVLMSVSIRGIVQKLEDFSKRHEALFAVPRRTLYNTFYIPKRSGGLRRIDAPKPELMEALREFKSILENDCKGLYHTAAYAYVKGRSCVNAIQRHQKNGSKWFLKTDFSDFFGSSTLDFVYSMITKLFPFSEVVKTTPGRAALERALSLCFLNGGLPQGTPVSPTLTNLMMIPIDHRLANSFARRDFTYTRYADDMLISSTYHFNKDKVVDYIRTVLREYAAPFSIKDQKTRYGSNCGSNWNLGLMLNKDNEITVGHMNKKFFKAAVCNFIADYQHGKSWSSEDANQLAGTVSYYRMVERDYFDYLINHFNQKFHVDFMTLLKQAAAGHAF